MLTNCGPPPVVGWRLGTKSHPPLFLIVLSLGATTSYDSTCVVLNGIRVRLI